MYCCGPNSISHYRFVFIYFRLSSSRSISFCVDVSFVSFFCLSSSNVAFVGRSRSTRKPKNGPQHVKVQSQNDDEMKNTSSKRVRRSGWFVRFFLCLCRSTEFWSTNSTRLSVRKRERAHKRAQRSVAIDDFSFIFLLVRRSFRFRFRGWLRHEYYVGGPIFSVVFCRLSFVFDSRSLNVYSMKFFLFSSFTFNSIVCLSFFFLFGLLFVHFQTLFIFMLTAVVAYNFGLFLCSVFFRLFWTIETGFFVRF